MQPGAAPTDTGIRAAASAVRAEVADGVARLYQESELVLAYHYDDGERYPYCHPVNLPGGPPITLYRPFDHVWHLGMYFAWKYINGVNVWEGRDAGEAYGGTRHVDLDRISDEAAGAGVRHAIDWIDSDGTPLLRDRRAVLVRPADSSSYHVIDWGFEFTPQRDVVRLDRKVEWGGYAGLSVRLPRSFLAPRVLNAEDDRDTAETSRACSRWTDYSGWIDGKENKTWGGVTIIEHPSNPRYPTPWLTYDSRDLQFLNAAFLRDEPYELRRGDTLRLAYRVLVHWGEGDPEVIEAEAGAFAATDPLEWAHSLRTADLSPATLRSGRTD